MRRRSFNRGMFKLMNQGYSKQGAFNKMKALATANNRVELSPEAGLFLLLVIVLALLGANQSTINWAIKLFGGALAGMITSAAAGGIVERAGGDLLKRIFVVLRIWKFKFSVTAFAIATTIVEVWLF